MERPRRANAFERGNDLLRRHRFRAALDCFDRAIEQGSRDHGYRVYLLRGVCLEKLRAKGQAEKSFATGRVEAILEHERARHADEVDAAVRREILALRRQVGLAPPRPRKRPARRR